MQQLQFAVKNSTVGKAATFTKVDNVIQESKNLMTYVTRTVDSCLACSSAVCSSSCMQHAFFFLMHILNRGMLTLASGSPPHTHAVQAGHGCQNQESHAQPVWERIRGRRGRNGLAGGRRLVRRPQLMTIRDESPASAEARRDRRGLATHPRLLPPLLTQGRMGFARASSFSISHSEPSKPHTLTCESTVLRSKVFMILFIFVRL